MLPLALNGCPKCKKSPTLVTLIPAHYLILITPSSHIFLSQSHLFFCRCFCTHFQLALSIRTCLRLSLHLPGPDFGPGRPAPGHTGARSSYFICLSPITTARPHFEKLFSFESEDFEERANNNSGNSSSRRNYMRKVVKR